MTSLAARLMPYGAMLGVTTVVSTDHAPGRVTQVSADDDESAGAS